MILIKVNLVQIHPTFLHYEYPASKYCFLGNEWEPFVGNGRVNVFILHLMHSCNYLLAADSLVCSRVCRIFSWLSINNSVPPRYKSNHLGPSSFQPFNIEGKKKQRIRKKNPFKMKGEFFTIYPTKRASQWT